MKKNILILITLMLTNVIFASQIFSKTQQGTYIPVMMYDTIKSTKSYYEGIKTTKAESYYTVLCITQDEVLSNIKFHDAYKIDISNKSFSFKTKKGKALLIDNDTEIEYIKISDSVNYYSAYDFFLQEEILLNIAKKNPKLKIEKASIIYDNEEWDIDKDQWHYSDKIEIILFSKTSRQYIGYSKGNFYSLKESEDLQKALDKEL